MIIKFNLHNIVLIKSETLAEDKELIFEVFWQ